MKIVLLIVDGKSKLSTKHEVSTYSSMVCKNEY